MLRNEWHYITGICSQFFVQLVEQDVRKQRTNRASLWNAFSSFV